MSGDPLEYLFSLERLGMKFGLDNITTLAAALGDPHRAFSSVIVAGTNGKGSVTAMTEHGLRAAGHRTARYTSPHLTRLEERFVIAGREVTNGALRDAAATVQHAAEHLVATGGLETAPTFFECATAMAFVLFRDAGVEIAVLEVGLGGRLDATNIVTPIAAAITSIDFDHEAQLGNTIASIAREKAGVIKPGIPVVCGPLAPEAEQVVRAACDAVAARLVLAPADLGALEQAPRALRGEHQRVNASVALTLLAQLDALGVRVGANHARAALGEVEWPGRLEERPFNGGRVLLDAAHNPAGVRALRTYLEQAGWTDGAIVFAAMQDKDAAAMIDELVHVCRAFVCTTAPTPRAAAAAALAALARRAAPAVLVEAIADPAAALARARALHPRVVVTGSIFLIGPVRDILRAS